MPLYEYYCADCRDRFEAIRPMTKADDPIQCKHCESPKTSRTLSMFAAHLGSNKAVPAAGNAGGGCCGGGMCGCGH